MKIKLLRRIIILIILLCGLLIFFNILKNNSKISESDINNSNNNQIDLMADDVIVASDANLFFRNYYNKISAKEIQENWDNFARKRIYDYTNNIKTKNDIKKYYEKNSNKIYKDTGILEYNDFESLMNKIIEKSDFNTLKLVQMQILDDISYENKVTLAELKAEYDNDVIIIFEMQVFDKKNDDGIFIVYK